MKRLLVPGGFLLVFVVLPVLVLGYFQRERPIIASEHSKALQRHVWVSPKTEAK